MNKQVVIVLAFFVAAMCGCAPSTNVKTEATPAPVFNWDPATTAAPNSAAVTFGIVGGEFGEDAGWGRYYPFSTFRTNMQGDFDELLTARGFITTGPFDTMEEMTYPDKKNCDLILVPDLDLTVPVQGLAFQEHTVLLGPKYWTINGTAILGGRVTLSVVESLSGTKMWNKSVAIDPVTVPYQGKTKFESPVGLSPNYGDEGMAAALAPHLEKAYMAILDKAWTYLDPEEMAVVKQQAMEVKENTRFQGS
ncbi:MAG: hypothetical protein AB7V45_16915 [Candidatus Krumholzibacteriia bacterium]